MSSTVFVRERERENYIFMDWTGQQQKEQKSIGGGSELKAWQQVVANLVSPNIIGVNYTRRQNKLPKPMKSNGSS